LQRSILHNEKELLVLSAQGDESAFTQLFYAYHNKLGSFVYQLTGSAEIAEEIIQDVFMKVWIKRELLLSVENFGSYIWTISKNHTLNCLRQIAKERIRNRQFQESVRTFSEEVTYIDPLPDYYNLLDEAVEELPPQQQKVYILSRRERLKYDEIARQMNLSKETVKAYLKLATRSISSYVRAHGDLMGVILLLCFQALVWIKEIKM